MRGHLHIAGALALAVLALSAAGQARAFELIVGGMAGKCSSEARLGKFDQATIEVCSMALAGEPMTTHNRAGTYVNRGAMLLHAGAWDHAHADFTQALKLEPRLGEAFVGEGGYLITQARYADAEREITQGLDLGAEEPEKAYYFRAMARWAQDDFAGAYSDFQQALALKPGWTLPREQLTHFTVTPAR